MSTNEVAQVRTTLQKFQDGSFNNLLDDIIPVTLEITGVEKHSNNVQYLPVIMQFGVQDLQALLQPFRTTILDVTLLRLPSGSVFTLTPS